ncbi:pectate lyase-like adhesive domain-containing protein [Methanobrevibacter sp.]|uniref:pectate lyase-like adhesive domain-containing protein n=1 Tax=Methanobrevibacter sp. TaxID=66852 RepID=UPI00386611A7
MSNNFKYLDDLIQKGRHLPIVLDSDIVLSDEEVSQYPEGILIGNPVIDIVIEGNAHTIDAKGKTRIFSCSGNVTLKNITFKNGFNDDGGAIKNSSGELNIEDCAFEGNAAVYSGGAIRNEFHTLRIIKSFFSDNSANKGGAISNTEDMYVSDSTIKNNITQDTGALDNRGNLVLRNVHFENNETENSDYDYDVCNYEEIHIGGDYSSDQQKSLFNEGCVQTSGSRDMIVNQGEIIESSVEDFTFLEDLINNSKEDVIKLEYDIALNCLADEDSKYYSGIKIYRNNLVIDGGGHTVDARGKTPIFLINGENIKIKNITLKNGDSSVEGGAIMNGGELIICNSKLCNNQANKNGGAIFNCKKLTVINCMFSKNGVGKSGGAIFNDGDLNIIDSTFSGNYAYLGSAILSTVEFDSNLKNCNFENKNREVVYDNNPPW